MSAAEKLRALRREERDDDLWFALPQIVAVVEAAERIAGAPSRNDNEDEKLIAARALAALDEALT